MQIFAYGLMAAVFWIIANLIAQRLYPTFTTDDPGRRMAYKFLTIALLPVAILLAAGAGALLGLH